MFGLASRWMVWCLSEADLDVEIPNPDAQIYQLSTDFIEQRFPSADAVLGPRVHAIVERLLAEGDCTHAGVAALLGMHPRTLQRRLRSEGNVCRVDQGWRATGPGASAFETIDDAVESDREAARLLGDLRALTQLLSMVRIVTPAASVRRLRRRLATRRRETAWLFELLGRKRKSV